MVPLLHWSVVVTNASVLGQGHREVGGVAASYVQQAEQFPTYRSGEVFQTNTITE